MNGSSSHAVCDAVAMLNNLSIVICTLSILPDKLQFAELYGEPKVSGISEPAQARVVYNSPGVEPREGRNPGSEIKRNKNPG